MLCWCCPPIYNVMFRATVCSFRITISIWNFCFPDILKWLESQKMKWKNTTPLCLPFRPHTDAHNYLFNSSMTVPFHQSIKPQHTLPYIVNAVKEHENAHGFRTQRLAFCDIRTRRSIEKWIERINGGFVSVIVCQSWDVIKEDFSSVGDPICGLGGGGVIARMDS